MRKYNWLFFDLDNTILDFGASSKEAFFTIFDSTDYVPSLEDYQVYNTINHQVWVNLEKGLLTLEELKTRRWQLFFKEKGIDLDPAVTNQAYFDYIKENPAFVSGAIGLIEGLAKSYDLCLVTNGLAEVQYPRLRLSGLDKLFPHIIVSEEIGVAKPKAAFFDHVMKVVGHPMKEEILMIGDTLTSDIRGGIDYGLDTCWYNYYGQENTTQYRPTYAIKSIKELLGILETAEV